MKARHSHKALADIRTILIRTAKEFGAHQLRAYAAIIDQGIQMVATEPMRTGSLSRDELMPVLRHFHLEHAAGRSGGAAHCLYYIIAPDEVVILRVLHERMEPRARIIAAYRED